jgi:hypothetical protein
VKLKLLLAIQLGSGKFGDDREKETNEINLNRGVGNPKGIVRKGRRKVEKLFWPCRRRLSNLIVAVRFVKFGGK